MRNIVGLRTTFTLSLSSGKIWKSEANLGLNKFYGHYFIKKVFKINGHPTEKFRRRKMLVCTYRI